MSATPKARLQATDRGRAERSRPTGDDLTRQLRPPSRTPERRFQVIGHRGAAGHAPENTAPAFEIAVALGVHAVELDVRLSRDGVPVVIHDSTVDRTTNGKGAVAELRLAELKELDAGGWWAPDFAKTRLLTLEEALDVIAGRVPVVVEIKEEDRLARLFEVCRGLFSGAAPGSIVFSSFSLETLIAAAEALPDVPREWLLRRGGYSCDGALALAREAPVARICPPAAEVDAAWVAAASEAGLGVRAWGIPSAQTGPMVQAMRKVVRSGAAGATADFPDVLLSTLKALACEPSKDTGAAG